MTALFRKKTEEESKDSKKSSKQNEEKSLQGQAGRVLSSAVLQEPLITEKAHVAAEANKYVFIVDRTATKTLIKQAIEQLYGVTVLGVRTQVDKPKKRQFGRSVGYTAGKKKATITLKKGDVIDLFKNA